MSRNTAHEALLAWAAWYGANPELKATRYDTAGRSTFDRARDDPSIPWRVLIIDGALSVATTMRHTAFRLYLYTGPLPRTNAGRNRGALHDYISHALDDPDRSMSIAQSSALEVRIRRRPLS